MITCKDTRNGSNYILKERKFNSSVKGYTKSDYNSKDFQVERTVKHLADYLFIPVVKFVKKAIGDSIP